MPKEEGVPKLIQVAQGNKNPEVRKQAMFWVGQSTDPRALKIRERKAPGFFVRTAVRIRSVARTA
jgi:hypothetical protein